MFYLFFNKSSSSYSLHKHSYLNIKIHITLHDIFKCIFNDFLKLYFGVSWNDYSE